MRQWYYILEGNVQGPLSEEDLVHVFASGALPSSTPVWHEGMRDWTSATGLPSPQISAEFERPDQSPGPKGEKIIPLFQTQGIQTNTITEHAHQSPVEQRLAVLPTTTAPDISVVNNVVDELPKIEKPSGLSDLPCSASDTSREQKMESRPRFALTWSRGGLLSGLTALAFVVWVIQHRIGAPVAITERGLLSATSKIPPGRTESHRMIEPVKASQELQLTKEKSTLKRTVEINNSDAATQYELGILYGLGKGVKQNDALAAEWFRKAADQNHVIAQYGLGVLYHEGRGVMQDEKESVKWYRKAAEQNFSDAQLALGFCYLYARGVAKDEVEAVKWFRKAAYQSDPRAYYALGCSYYSGLEKNVVEAYAWLSLSARTDKSASILLDGLKAEMSVTQLGDGQRRFHELELQLVAAGVQQVGADAGPDRVQIRPKTPSVKSEFKPKSIERMPTRVLQNGETFYTVEGRRILSEPLLYAGPFSDGLAKVWTKRGWGYINSLGKFVQSPSSTAGRPETQPEEVAAQISASRIITGEKADSIERSIASLSGLKGWRGNIFAEGTPTRAESQAMILRLCEQMTFQIEE